MRKFLFLLLLAPCFGHAQSVPKYTIQDLSTLPGMSSCAAISLSQSGLVTGWCSSGGSAFSGFIYSNGAMKNLGAPPIPAAVLPLAVNDSGVVVGDYLQGDLTQGVLFVGPFVYQNGSIQNLTNVSQAFVPFALSNSGQIAGTQLNNPSELFLSYFYGQAMQIQTPGGAPSPLPPVGATQAVALGMSANGKWVAGSSAARDGSTVLATLWQAGAGQALPLLAGFNYAEAAAVNDSGVAAGAAYTINYHLDEDPAATAHAAIFSSTSVTDLGVLPGDRTSFAMGINNSGLVVGYSSMLAPGDELQAMMYINPGLTGYHAFLYANGRMYSLGQLLANGAGWQLNVAMAINNAGQIVGSGFYQGQLHAYLLTPVKPPVINSISSAGLSVPAVATLSPNGLFSIFGTTFAPAGMQRVLAKEDLVNNALPTTLANTCVQAGTTKLGLTYVSATQINAIAGSLPSSGKVPLSVLRDCGTAQELASDPLNVSVAAQAPEFLYFVQNANGQNPVATIDAQTGAYVGPPNLIPGATFTPAHANDVLTAFGVGWGATNPPTNVGSIATSAAVLAGQYSLSIGGLQAPILYAGLSPSYAGLYQINFSVPPGLLAGNQPLVLTVNGVSSPAGAFLAVVQ